MRSFQSLAALFSVLFLSPPAAALGGSMLPDVDMLDFRVLDAEYSRALDRIVAVSTTPENRLHLYDPVDQSGVAIALPLAPRCVSVAPDGLTAAVGHNGWVTRVDLVSKTVLETWPVSTVALDIVLAGNGFAYVFPTQNQWEKIRCVDLATGVEKPHSGLSIYAGTVAKLHPDGDAIYGADNGLSPSDIEKYSITGGTAQYLYDSPYHGNFAMCGDLWMAEDGLRIFTRCSNVFRASEVPAEDMLYAGSFSNVNLIEHLAHSSTAGKIALVPEGATLDRKLQLYGETFLGFEQEVGLPQVSVGASDFPTHGRFVMFSQDASRIFVVSAVDPSSGLLYDHGIATYLLDDACAGAWSSTCSSLPNSTGQTASLALQGSLSIAANDTWLAAAQAPPGTLGLFILGNSAGQTPFGDGVLCIGLFGGGMKRPFDPLLVGPGGEALQHIDFTQLPADAQIPPGATRYFQLWFRDPGGPLGTNFNLSDGLEAVFCP